jgi:hypothetical protein
MKRVDLDEIEALWPRKESDANILVDLLPSMIHELRLLRQVIAETAPQSSPDEPD